MITREDITRLGQLNSAQGILSVYIHIDPALAYDRGQPATKFRSASARTRKNADDQTIAVLDRERDRVLKFLEGWEQQGRGIAIFASTPDAIWEVIELGVRVSTTVSVASTPNIDPLARIIDDYPRLCVVILDGGDGRIYFAEQGAGRKIAETNEELPNRHDQGGWSQGRYQRHVEFHKKAQLSEVADLVKDAFYSRGFDRLILVGVETVTKEFEGMLSDPVRQRVIGHLQADFKQENDNGILDRASELADEEERSAETALVETVIGYTDQQGKGVLGVEHTILALIEGQVDILLLVEGLSQPGSSCENCDYFAATEFAQCPVCSSPEVEELADVIGYAVEYAISHGARVNFVYNGAEEMLITRGGIGALLHYPIAPKVMEHSELSG